MRDLYAISTDSAGNSQSYAVDMATASVTSLGSLGSRITGGLAYRPASRLFFAIAQSTGGGAPGLAILSGDATFLARQPMTKSFTGGLAYRPGDDALYAIENRPYPDVARIHRVRFDGTSFELFGLAVRQFSGIVYNARDDRFYALGTDNTGFTSLYSIQLTGRVQQLMGAGLRAYGGIAYALHQNLFYFAANESDGTSYLWRLSLSGEVTRLMSLGRGFDGGSLCSTPWFGGQLKVKTPLFDERFVAQETVHFEAEVVDNLGQKMWDSTGISWTSDRDGLLGTGIVDKKLSVNTHAITAQGYGLTRPARARVFPDLWALYQAPLSEGEINRILSDFAFVWLDGAAGDPTQQWATYPGYPFDQSSDKPSRTAVLAKLDILRHQRFSSPLPISPATSSFYDHLRTFTRTIRVTLATPLNQAGGGIMDLNRSFASWSGLLPYVHNLYLAVHENRHNEPGEPLHTTADCTAWDGTNNPAGTADAKFEPGSGYAAAALYLFWVYKYSLYDPANIKDEAKLAANSLKGRFCAKPASTDPRVQALLTELWGA
jgi:hypothetical protein